VEVTDDHFSGDFFCLDEKFSFFEIPGEFSFQDREFVFNELSSRLDDVIEPSGHFLSVRPTNEVSIPGSERDNRIDMKDFPDQPVNGFRVVSPIHDIKIGFPEIVALPE